MEFFLLVFLLCLSLPAAGEAEDTFLHNDADIFFLHFRKICDDSEGIVVLFDVDGRRPVGIGMPEGGFALAAGKKMSETVLDLSDFPERIPRGD